MRKFSFKQSIIWLATLFVLVGCGQAAQTSTSSQSSASSQAGSSVKLEPELRRVIIGSLGSDAEVWQFIAEHPETEKAGLHIEVRVIDDGFALNRAVAEGEVDANAFQSIGYLKSFNEDTGEHLAPVAITYMEPMGLYSKKHASLADIPEGATFAIADNPANTTRALRLIESAGLIKLKDDFNDGTGTPEDIVENPKNIQFVLIDDTTGVRVLDDVDAVAIGNTIALEGGLNVLTDAIYKEEVNDTTVLRYNVVAVKQEHAKDHDLLKLSALYHHPEVQQFITEKFSGTKVPVTRSVEEVWGE